LRKSHDKPFQEEHSMRKITKRSAAIIAASIVGVGALGGVAMANGWLVGGKGYASATGSTVTDMRADITLSGKLFPGAALTAKALVDNPNEFPVKLSGISNPVITATKGGAPNDSCVTALGTTGAASVTPTLPSSAPVIGAKANNQAVDLPLNITQSFPQACADTLINLTFDFAGTSAV
jgi:hypothetical protein